MTYFTNYDGEGATTWCAEEAPDVRTLKRNMREHVLYCYRKGIYQVTGDHEVEYQRVSRGQTKPDPLLWSIFVVSEPELKKVQSESYAQDIEP